MPKSDVYYIEVLGKALDILDVFVQSQKERLSLQEISKSTGLNKNTVFRVLYTLAQHGYIVKKGHDYEFGPKVLDLGNTMLRQNNLLSVCGAYMDSLRERFSETVNLGILDGGQIRYVDVRESPHRFRLAERVGGSDYLHCTALGKCFLAYLPAEQVRQLLKQYGMPRQTDRTVTTLSALKAALERVRRDGYAVDPEESMEGACCVGVPILDGNGTPVAAMSISGPTTRFNQATVPAAAAALRQAAAEIRAKLRHK